METLTDKLRDLLLEDEIYNNIMKDAVKEILERTEGHKLIRERLILTLFSHCILTLTNSKYNIYEKIAHSKEEAEGCVNIIDADIEIEKWKMENGKASRNKQ